MGKELHKLHAAADPAGAAQADAADRALQPVPAQPINLRAELGLARQRIAELSRELLTLKGDDARPERGCHIARVIVGDAAALVEYEHQAAEAPNYDVESPLCGPGHPEVITPLRVFINGHWCDIGDVVAALDDARLIERIYMERGQ